MSTDIKTVLTNNGITLLSNLIANKSKINWSSAYSTSSSVPTTGSSPDIHADLTTLAGWSINNISPRTCSGSVTSANYKKVTSGGNTSEYIEVTCTLYNDPNNNYTGEARAIGIFIKDENDQDVLLAVAVRDDVELLHTFSGASGSTDTNDQVYFTCFVSLSKSTDITSLNVSLPNTGFYALSSNLNSFKDEIIIWRDKLYKENGDNPATGLWPSFESKMNTWADKLYKENGDDPATGEWPTFEASMNTWKDDVDSDLTTWKTGFYDPTEEGSSDPTSTWLKFKKDMIGTWNSWVSDFTGVTTADNQVISGVKTFKPSYTSPASSSETQPTNGIYFVKYDSANTSLIPETDNTCYLGTSAKKFKNVYATTFNGSLDGNAASATYATSAGSTNSALTATNANNIYVSTVSGSYDYPLVFMSSTSAGGSVSSGNKPLYTDSVNSCYYNPSTNTLTCPNFNGNLSGTATKATQDGNGNIITSRYISNVDAPTTSTSVTVYSTSGSSSSSIQKGNSYLTVTKNGSNSSIYLTRLVANILADSGSPGSLRLCLCKLSTGNVSAGSYVAGSSLRICNIRNYTTSGTSYLSMYFNENGTSQSGTWRLLSPYSDSSNSWVLVLAVRVVA